MKPTQRLAGALMAAMVTLAILALPSAAAAKDRNHDRIPDRWEKRHRLALTAHQARRDQDDDGLRNRGEFLAGDNPRDADSDDDGTADGEENAGTIQSFDPQSGKLVIDLFNGDSVSGLVTPDTEIECEDEGTASASDDSADDGVSEDGGSDDGTPEQAADDGVSDDETAEDPNCTTADLVPAAVVEEAELQAANGAATFEEVELAG